MRFFLTFISLHLYLFVRLINVLSPNAISKINTGKIEYREEEFYRDGCLGENSFKLMENIARFTQAARAYGLSDSEIFQTVDLYEKMNLHQVILCLFGLGRKVQKKNTHFFFVLH